MTISNSSIQRVFKVDGHIHVLLQSATGRKLLVAMYESWLGMVSIYRALGDGSGGCAGGDSIFRRRKARAVFGRYPQPTIYAGASPFQWGCMVQRISTNGRARIKVDSEAPRSPRCLWPESSLHAAGTRKLILGVPIELRTPRRRRGNH